VGRTVRVFHISDLHGRSEDGPQGERARREAPLRWRVIRKEWDKNLAALREEGRPVDLVVFTGDLGDWGHETDYAMGVELLRRTCQALAVPLERLFVVPGNHDIARKTEEAAWKALRDKLAHAGPAVGLAASSWMAGDKAPAGFEDAWRDAVLQRQANFWKAMTDLGRDELRPRQPPHGRLGYQVQVTLDGLAAPLWVVGLDTAWLAGSDADIGALRLTDHQVELLTSGKGGDDLPGFRLALMHHRFADLADGERARRLLADRVDLVLHGHQHEPAVEPWASPDHGLLVLAAGCLYEGDEHHRYPNACQMIDLALGTDGRPERVTIRFRGWAERNGLFWGDDGLLYRSAQHGRLVLRRQGRGWSIDDQPRDPPKPPWQPATGEVLVGRRNEFLREHVTFHDKLRTPEVREQLSQFRVLFSRAQQQIVLLGRYKKFHDVLQELERSFNVIERNRKRLLELAEAWDELRDPLMDMHLFLEEALGVLEQDRLRDEFDTARLLLADAVSSLTAAMAGDPRKLDDVVRNIRHVLGRDLSSADVRLLATVRELGLREVVGALRSVVDNLGSGRASSVSIDDLAQRIVSLDELRAGLEALVQEHHQWQWIDNELRVRVDRGPAAFDEALLPWTLVRARLHTARRAGADADSIQKIDAAVKKLDGELDRQVEPAKWINSLRDLKRYCNLHFSDVDKQLLLTCEKLQDRGETQYKVRDTLDAVLEVIDER
jgi:predicted MPP superfamily phosphohydrolase